MPRIIDCQDDAAVSLDECIELIGPRGVDLSDEESLGAGAIALRRLNNNRDFLGDMLVEQLADRHKEIGQQSAYGPQAIVLSPLIGGSFLRPNIWPSKNDACFQASGAKTFVYGVPHDHNFSFLTSGYFGPGYASDYYEYQYADVAGFVGEKPELTFVERSSLSEGKMMLYRAHCDIHSQIPPESMSVSLNIMHIDPVQGWFDQYGFDLEEGSITGLLNPTSTECFLRCAVGLGGEEAIDLASYFGKHHPSDRIRLASYEARALRLVGERAEAIWQEAEQSGSRLLREEARERRLNLEREFA
jgi:hypothetical protein